MISIHKHLSGVGQTCGKISLLDILFKCFAHLLVNHLMRVFALLELQFLDLQFV